MKLDGNLDKRTASKDGALYYSALKDERGGSAVRRPKDKGCKSGTRSCN